MDPLTLAIHLAGAAHFGILIASATAPRALNWRTHLATLPPLLRQMFWVYGVFIVITIVSFGLLTLFFAAEMAAGEPVARAVCVVIAVFWGARLIVQFFVFDAEPWLVRPLYRIGYHALSVVFVFLTLVYTWAAISPNP